MENVLPKMYKLLYKNNRLLEDKTWRNRALIIKDNKLFLIDNDLCVFECDEVSTPHYEAYLIPVIKETADLDPTESILRAFRYANKMRNANFFPVTVFDSKTKKKKVFYK